jgi:hypothetical protein
MTFLLDNFDSLVAFRPNLSLFTPSLCIDFVLDVPIPWEIRPNVPVVSPLRNCLAEAEQPGRNSSNSRSGLIFILE